MTALWFLVAVAILAGTFTVGMRVQQVLSSGPKTLEPLTTVAPVNPVHSEQLRSRDDLIAVLSSVTVQAATPWTVLPWQQVPDPVTTSREQSLMDEVQDLRDDLASMEALMIWKDSLRARYLHSLRNARKRLRESVPVQSLEAVDELRSRSLSVARSAFGRAAELSTALTEIEVARFEALDLSEFNESMAGILDRHPLIGATP